MDLFILFSDYATNYAHYKLMLLATNSTSKEVLKNTLNSFLPEIYLQTFLHPRAEMTENDIRTLQNAGITDADIVRLSELNAFLAYQVRLVATLSLLSESTP